MKYTAFYRIHPDFNFYHSVHEAAMHFSDEYVPIMTLDVENIEVAFGQMQGENWSPNGEARDTIKLLGLSHTSMSVGDVFYSHSDDKYYMVKDFGWCEIEMMEESI